MVNSYDEWSALEEVIVGTPYHMDYHDDSSFRMFLDAAGFVEIFETADVIVRRPQALTEVPNVRHRTGRPRWATRS